MLAVVVVFVAATVLVPAWNVVPPPFVVVANLPFDRVFVPFAKVVVIVIVARVRPVGIELAAVAVVFVVKFVFLVLVDFERKHVVSVLVVVDEKGLTK